MTENVGLERLTALPSFNGRKLWGQAFLPFFVYVVGKLSESKGEVYISGLENLVEKDGSPLPGPALWLPKHEDWNDFVHLPMLWKKMGKPAINGLSRSNYFPGNPSMSRLVSFLMTNTLFVEIDRTSTLESISEQEKETMRQRNEKQLAILRDNYLRGIHVVIAPEGTSKSEGRISPIKAGAYNLSHVVLEDKTVAVVPCVPIGNTYDFLAGPRDQSGKRKNLVFFRFGAHFIYRPVDSISGESENEYGKRDRTSFAQKVHDSFIELNTITASQLGCEYILSLAKTGTNGSSKLIHEMKLKKVILERVTNLREVGGLVFDPALLSADTRAKRVRQLYLSLQRLGYISSSGEIKTEIVLREPLLEDGSVDTERYKKNDKGGNILRYSANRLVEVAQSNAEVRAVLERKIVF